MKKTLKKSGKVSLASAPPYVDSIEILKDELEETLRTTEVQTGEVLHAEPGALQAVKSTAKGHGEQTVLPDDCEFGDNDLCYVET